MSSSEFTPKEIVLIREALGRYCDDIEGPDLDELSVSIDIKLSIQERRGYANR
jgi:hypothetical protein